VLFQSFERIDAGRRAGIAAALPPLRPADPGQAVELA